MTRLVYDGDCGFCRYTVIYAQSITGDAVSYRPYQQVAEDHGEVSEAEFQASIQLFENGSRYQGAEAAFRTLAIGGVTYWLWAYRRLPGFAVITEFLYRWVSSHRSLSLRVARPLCGTPLQRLHYARTADLVYRGVALCSLFAFGSLWWQIEALIGTGGVLPFDAYLDAARSQLGNRALWLLPGLLWLGGPETWSNVMLHGLCAVGTAGSLIGLLGRWRTSTALITWVCWLSLVHAGQTFTAYQWDILLLECLLAAAILSRIPRMGVWLFRLLLFRFMFLAGFAKLASADPSWADGTALLYHFETQPLPTTLAWYFHNLPASILIIGTWAALFIELLLPFLIFAPRNPRLLAAAAFIVLEVLILLSGSYNYFNILTIVLCLALLDDRLLRLPVRGIGLPSAPPPSQVGQVTRAGVKPRQRFVSHAAALVLMTLGLMRVGNTLWPDSAALSWTTQPLNVVRSWAIASPYGLFAAMTTERFELVIEGSLEGNTWPPGEEWRPADHWQAWKFPFKPGAVDARPRLATPHQPRLDWQMWFAALGPPRQSPWMQSLVMALLTDNATVGSLVHSPFPGQTPRAIRVLRYRYTFTSPEERAQTGSWWRASGPELWLGPMELRAKRLTIGADSDPLLELGSEREPQPPPDPEVVIDKPIIWE